VYNSVAISSRLKNDNLRIFSKIVEGFFFKIVHMPVFGFLTFNPAGSNSGVGSWPGSPEREKTGGIEFIRFKIPDLPQGDAGPED
jgi:hypothetical protein